MIGLLSRFAHRHRGDVEGRRLVGLAHVAGPLRMEMESGPERRRLPIRWSRSGDRAD